MSQEGATPLVSVIVTSYNQASTILTTLDSILFQQCRFDVEIIVGDDGSTDETRFVCQEYNRQHSGRLRLLFQEQNRGVGANWALAVSRARGKYIATCAADDYWHLPTKLQQQVEYMEAHPECGLLYTDYDVLDSQKGTVTPAYLAKSNKVTFEGEDLTAKIFAGQVPILTLTTLFRKELADTYIPYEDYIKYRFPLEDWPSWLILSMYTSIHYLPVSTATYRKGHESISNPLQLAKAEKKFKREFEMYTYLCNRFPETLPFNEASYRVYANHNLLRLAFKNKDFTLGREYASKLKQDGVNSIFVNAATYKIPFYAVATARNIYQKMKAR